MGGEIRHEIFQARLQSDSGHNQEVGTAPGLCPGEEQYRRNEGEDVRPMSRDYEFLPCCCYFDCDSAVCLFRLEIPLHTA